MTHPYRSQSELAFWSRSVSRSYSSVSVGSTAGRLLGRDDLVVSAGSCFASNIVPWLEQAGVTYVRTEQPHPRLAGLPENLGYRNFSAAYGNVYTARQLAQLLRRALGTFRPVDDRWEIDGRWVDPFRPGLRHAASSSAEFDVLTRQHLDAVLAAFTTATVFVVTLGLTEAWESSVDGAVYPACPGTIAGEFDADLHKFHNFTATEVSADLRDFIDVLRSINPRVRFILTVSPVPLVATATPAHVLVASTLSKSRLRVAAAEVASEIPGVTYFPAYEIITGPQAPSDYFEADRRNVSEVGVRAVMESLLANSGLQITEPDEADGDAPPVEPEVSLSEMLVSVECEEMMTES